MQGTSSSAAAPPVERFGGDVQSRTPSVAVGLSRVGVTGVEKVVRIADDLFFARLECFVDLGNEQKGAHMSRFEEVVNEAIGEVVLSESRFRAETLAQQIAELVRTRRRGRAVCRSPASGSRRQAPACAPDSAPRSSPRRARPAGAR
ncbi:MAG TPA: GTP cyclohydrolase, FolE2/MptA family, partial [Solirubrobacteraceae bacterium]|nr:GTP cyclohydrolase, FolE2/MptA family [Solirubrobacteraceae bacterium]